MSNLEDTYEELLEKHKGKEDTVQECVQDMADSSCTSGYDNDGSTGYEIFSNGLELGKAVGEDDEVLELHLDGSVAFFITSDVDELCKKIVKAVDDYVKEYG